MEHCGAWRIKIKNFKVRREESWSSQEENVICKWGIQEKAISAIQMAIPEEEGKFVG